MILNQNLLPSKTWDFCVVGSGPVGMALALELERLGHEVLLLESGGLEFDLKGSPASTAIIRDELRHAPMEIAVCRAFGGTSWTWGGRCVAYDDVDLLDRDFVPDSHWPIAHDEIRPWYKAAVPYMSCGSDQFSIPYRQALSDGLTLDAVERWATDARLILLHRDKLLASAKIQIALHATVTGMNFSAASDGNPQQAIDSLLVTTPSGNETVRARHVILATGGVETTRLLLNVQRHHPSLFGGPDGPLGRYYMGHLSGKIATIHFDNPASFADLDFMLDETTGAWIRRRFMLDTETQLANNLLNIAFWPDNPPFYDPSHRSGVLSAVFLALAFPPSGRKLLSEAIRLAHTGPKPYPLLAHLRNTILGAPRAIKDIYRILRDRFIRKPKKPGFLVPNSGGEYALHYHAEQIPQPDSRITLAAHPEVQQVDAYGMPRAVIDLRYAQQDIDSVIQAHHLLDKALRANKIGHLKFWYPEAELPAVVWSQAADGFHQVGSIRMGNDPATSVVDSNIKAHGVANLHVASSAVFPSSGQANSTLLAVALGLRLVHHIHSNHIPESSAAPGQEY